MILSEVRELLYDTVVPNIDNEANVGKFNQYLNFACERYINSGEWKGTNKEVSILTTDNYLTLPPRFHSCLAVRFQDDSNIGGLTEIKNQWFRYQPGGSYLWKPAAWVDAGYSTDLGDLGDGFVVFTNSPYTNYKLRVTCESADDIGLKILVKGYDTTGSQIFSDFGEGSYEGEIITVTPGVTVTTTTQFSGQLYFLQKQPSQGYVKLEAVDVATSAATTIGRYSPSETVINYRRYATGAKSVGYTSANIIAKLRFVLSKSDSDEIFPSNLGALQCGLMSIKFEKEGDIKSSQGYFAQGIKLLNDEARASRGGAQFTMKISAAAFQFERLYQGV